MTAEEKELLLKDLCSRLPYRVAVKFKVNEVKAVEEKFVYNIDGEYSYITDGKSYLKLNIIELLSNNYLDEIKPYLFPMSSMTEEQKIIYGDLCYAIIHSLAWDTQAALNELVDWLNENHFDYNNLIPMGLANDATGLNIY